jgi:type IV secretory pathway VirB2 component (pilin)
MNYKSMAVTVAVVIIAIYGLKWLNAKFNIPVVGQVVEAV